MNRRTFAAPLRTFNMLRHPHGLRSTCALALGAWLTACGSDGDGGGGSDASASEAGVGPDGSARDGGPLGTADGSVDTGVAGGNDGGADGGALADGATPDGGSDKTVCRAPAPKANPSMGNTCRNAAPPAIKLTPVASGLDLPVYVTQAPNDKTKLYVVELRGKIKTITNGQVDATPFLDITSKVVTMGESGLAGEQGLLGLAFDPNYARTGRLWVKYSKTGTPRGDDTVAMYTATPGGAADASSERVLAEVSAPHPDQLRNHNGGMLAFGPDGCLYIAYGDGGGGGDPRGNGQSKVDLFGSLLRIDVENFPAAAPGNLAGANPHVWNYGLRNPWRFSFDRANGDLYIGDVGQDAWEEVDVEPAGTGGRNYGWNVMEGKHCYPSTNSNCDQSGKTLPAVEFTNPAGLGQASVIGGYVYRGAAIPNMVGRYIYADSYSRQLKSFTYSGETSGVPGVCDEYNLNTMPTGNPYSFGEDLDGELYITTADGFVYKIEPN